MFNILQGVNKFKIVKKLHIAWCNEGSYKTSYRLRRSPILKFSSDTDEFSPSFFLEQSAWLQDQQTDQSVSCIAFVQPCVMSAEEVKVSLS